MAFYCPMTCPVCSSEHGRGQYDDDRLVGFECKICGLSDLENSTSVRFKPDWVSEHAPEEPGRYLVQRSNGAYSVAEYRADEGGDYWNTIDRTGRIIPTAYNDVAEWAELPACCSTELVIEYEDGHRANIFVSNAVVRIPPDDAEAGETENHDGALRDYLAQRYDSEEHGVILYWDHADIDPAAEPASPNIAS